MFGLNKLTAYLLAALFVAGAVATTYYVWKRNVEQQALLEFNRQQIEQTAKDQAEFNRRQQEIANQQAAAARALVSQNENLNRRISNIDRFLTSPQTQDRPASDVLKQTIERLRAETQQ